MDVLLPFPWGGSFLRFKVLQTSQLTASYFCPTAPSPCVRPPTLLNSQVIEALAVELAEAASAAGPSDGGKNGDDDEMADAVTLETVRETLGAALDDEIRRSEGDEVMRLGT